MTDTHDQSARIAELESYIEKNVQEWIDLRKQVAELEGLIKRAMIPTQEAMQQSQGSPVFLPQGSKLVAGHEGVFVEDKEVITQTLHKRIHEQELEIQQLRKQVAELESAVVSEAVNKQAYKALTLQVQVLREALLNILVSDCDFARIDAIANEALNTTPNPDEWVRRSDLERISKNEYIYRIKETK